MIDAISQKEWQQLPTAAQRQVKDFFLFIQAKYSKEQPPAETALLSESALAKDWLKEEEDEAWAEFQ